MSIGDKSPRREKPSTWRQFATYFDPESGLQLTIDKGGSTFSPRIRFEHKKNGTISSYGRITPDFESNLDEFHPLRSLAEGLERLVERAEKDLVAEAKRDQEAFLKRHATNTKKQLKR